MTQDTSTPSEDQGAISPWARHLFEARQAMAARLESGEPLGRRVSEFWAEATWPLHSIDADARSAEVGGDFLRRLARQGLTPAMNVALHHKNSHVIGATFGPHAFEMSHDYGAVERAIADREKAIEAGTYEDPAQKLKEFKARPKALQKLHFAAMGAEVDLEPKKTGPAKRNNFAYLASLEERDYPAPNASPETQEAWVGASERARALCEKFGLRSVSAPLAFDSAQAIAFIDKLDGALDQLAQFVGVEPKALGLDQWLGLRARAPGARDPEEAFALEDGASLAAKEKAQAEKEKNAAKKQKSDSEHGMFMGYFIQIEVSPNFEPVVLAHEWFHSLDLWFGSREIVAAQPWRGWSVFASRVAFTDFEQSEGLKAWAKQLREGGEPKCDPALALPSLSFLSQMRFDHDENPPGEFEKPLADSLAARLMRAFGDIALSDEAKAQTQDQAGKLAQAMVEAAFEHARDYAHSQQTEESLERRRREFYDEWADLACMWGKRQAGEAATPDQIRDMEAGLRAQTLRSLAGAWCHSMMSKEFPKPDAHVQHAMRMDASAGRMSPYFCTPHEMLAYKLEELFLSKAEPAPDDLVGAKLLGWLREEAAPALNEARAVSLASLMGVKTRKPTA